MVDIFTNVICKQNLVIHKNCFEKMTVECLLLMIIIWQETLGCMTILLANYTQVRINQTVLKTAAACAAETCGVDFNRQPPLPKKTDITFPSDDVGRENLRLIIIWFRNLLFSANRHYIATSRMWCTQQNIDLLFSKKIRGNCLCLGSVTIGNNTGNEVHCYIYYNEHYRPMPLL